MQSGGPHIEITFFTAAMQDPKGQNIGQQAGNRNNHHRFTGHRLRMMKALNGLPDDEDRNDH